MLSLAPYPNLNLLLTLTLNQVLSFKQSIEKVGTGQNGLCLNGPQV